MSGSSLGPGTIEWRGVQYRTLLTSEETKGAMSIVDSLSPAGSGPPRHIHADADETFVLLEGDVEFWVAGQHFRRRPGETMFVPRNTEHTFQVPGPAPSRHLTILTPGGFEGFFSAMADGALRIPEDMEAIVGIASRFHLTFTGPPLPVETGTAAA